jgi:hypothetical protein
MKQLCFILFLGLSISAYAQQDNRCLPLKVKRKDLNIADSARGITLYCGRRPVNPNPKPVLVIDQKRIPLDQLASLNPDDILSVNILKGEKAILLYGPDGANGAIIVVTKCEPRHVPAL